MQFRITIIPHTLKFKFDARTSRGAISTHTVYYLKLWSVHDPSICGIGEFAPLPGLSIEHCPTMEQKLHEVVQLINKGVVHLGFEGPLPEELGLSNWPALCFALETALLDLKCGGRRVLYRNGFTKGEDSIPINGLVWMGDKQFMQQQIKNKIAAGFTCLKLKIGSLDFDTELEILQQIRETATAEELIIRVDANGAFEVEEALKKLERLAKYSIHSIEQPIKQGQVDDMSQLCAYTPIPIALDEELIGTNKTIERTQLLEAIKPQFIIIKPTLVGGMQASAEWIRLAEAQGIGWWITSALESNIGLNAISQFTANYKQNVPQGLGTGQLYHNNIESPLSIDKGKLHFKRNRGWHEPDGVTLF